VGSRGPGVRRSGNRPRQFPGPQSSTGVNMRRVLWFVMIVALLIAAFVAGGYAAAKSYQFTGTVKAADSGTLTVEKSAKETWQFDVPKDVKGGTPKVGDKVTVYYKMVATEIESKPAGTAPAKTPPAKKK